MKPKEGVAPLATGGTFLTVLCPGLALQQQNTNAGFFFLLPCLYLCELLLGILCSELLSVYF